MLSLLVFLLISKNLTSPLEIPLSSLSLQCNRSFRVTHFNNGDLTKSYETQPTRHLRPIIPNNTCPFCITAAAAQILAGASFARHVTIHSHASMFLLKEFYKQYTIHHSRDIAGSHFRALSMIPHCCLPWEPGPCLSPSVADHPLRPAKDL